MQTGTTQEEEVNKDNEQCKADGKDAIDIQSSKLQTDVTTAVASGKASIFYADSTVSAYAIKQTGDTLETLGEDAGGVPRPWPSRRAIPRPPKPCRRPSRS